MTYTKGIDNVRVNHDTSGPVYTLYLQVRDNKKTRVVYFILNLA
jgi:hypothetical protein